MAILWPFMAKRGKMTKMCYLHVDVLSSLVILSHFKGPYLSVDLKWYLWPFNGHTMAIYGHTMAIYGQSGQDG